MKKLIPFFFLSASVVTLVVCAAQPTSAQGGGKLAVFSDMVLMSGNNQPRNCFNMNRYKVGENAGFRITVIDTATGEPAKDADVVVHLSYGGKTEDVPARYRGAGGRGNTTPNLWTAKWVVPAGTPTGKVDVRITAMDKMGRSGEFRPFPNEAGQLTIVNE
jgi:hypothetical protein